MPKSKKSDFTMSVHPGWIGGTLTTPNYSEKMLNKLRKRIAAASAISQSSKVSSTPESQTTFQRP